MYLRWPPIFVPAQKNRRSNGCIGICQNASLKSNTNAFTLTTFFGCTSCFSSPAHKDKRNNMRSIASKIRGSITRCFFAVMRFTSLSLVSRIVRALSTPLRVFTMSPSLLRIGLPPTYFQSSLPKGAPCRGVLSSPSGWPHDPRRLDTS